MYKLIFDEKAIDYLNKLPNKTKQRIIKKILSTKNNPHRYFERLEGRKEYKLRIGEYRVIADIQNNTLCILLLKIGHRKNIYKEI